MTNKRNTGSAIHWFKKMPTNVFLSSSIFVISILL